MPEVSSLPVEDKSRITRPSLNPATSAVRPCSPISTRSPTRAPGILANRELSEEITQNNVEGLVAAKYSVFIYDNPEVSFDISSNIIPSLSNLGRIRSETESNLKWEVFNDFFLKWTFYYSFDSKPLAGGAEKSDWALTLLGVEYKL